MRTLRLELSLIAASLSFVACDRARNVYLPTAATEAGRVIRIGTFGSLTGEDQAAGLAENRGFRLAIETCNAGGGVKKSLVELVSYDDQSRASASMKAAERLASQDKVDLIVGGSSPERARDAAAAAGSVPLASATCGAFTDPQAAHVIGLGSGAHERAESVAESAVVTMGARTIAVLSRAGVASDREAALALQSSLRARGAQARETFTITPETFEAVLTELASDPPQAVCVAFDGGDAARLGLALRRRRIPSALHYFGPPDLDILPAADRTGALEGACFPTTFDAGAEQGAIADFKARFRARFEIDATERGLAGYAAGMRVIEAFSRVAGSRSARISSALEGTENPFPLFVMRVESGRFVRTLAPRQ